MAGGGEGGGRGKVSKWIRKRSSPIYARWLDLKGASGGGGAIRVPLGSDQTVFPPLLAILGPVENRAHACSVSEIMTMS